MYLRCSPLKLVGCMVVFITSHRQRDHLETAPRFTVPGEGREARLLHRFYRESNSGSLRCSPLHFS